MPISRLSQLEENLENFREQLGGFEETMITAPEEEKTRLKQRIRKLRKDMQPFEQEYWEILAQRAGEIEITEPEAEVIIAEIVEQYPQIQGSQENTEVLALLQKIYEKVNQPGATAAGKLKGSLSLLPPFVGVTYEAELDTENTLRKYFPTFTNWTKKIDTVSLSHQPIIIAGQSSNAVLLSEADLASVQETLYLLSIPGMGKSIREGLATPIEECDRELEW